MDVWLFGSCCVAAVFSFSLCVFFVCQNHFRDITTHQQRKTFFHPVKLWQLFLFSDWFCAVWSQDGAPADSDSDQSCSKVEITDLYQQESWFRGWHVILNLFKKLNWWERNKKTCCSCRDILGNKADDRISTWGCYRLGGVVTSSCFSLCVFNWSLIWDFVRCCDRR